MVQAMKTENWREMKNCALISSNVSASYVPVRVYFIPSVSLSVSKDCKR